MSIFNDISWGSRDNEKEASQLLDSFLFMQVDLEQDNGHFWVLVQRKSGPLSVRTVYKVNETMSEKMMLTSAESGHTVFHATSPLRRGQLKSKDGVKLSIHYLPIWKQSKLFCRRLFL